MNTTIDFEIIGRIPSKKNSRRNFKKTSLPSIGYLQWERNAILQVPKELKHKKYTCIGIEYHVTLGSNHRKDLDNIMCSINDMMVKSGIIIDDDWKNTGWQLIAPTYIKGVNKARIILHLN